MPVESPRQGHLIEDLSGRVDGLPERGNRNEFEGPEWELDEDNEAEIQDPVDLLQSAYTQLRARHYSLWTVETGEHQLAGWIIRERDEEAMELVAGALGMHARVGVG